MSHPHRRRSRRRVFIAGGALVAMLVLVGAVVVIRAGVHPAAHDGAPCQATASGATFDLDLDQARNATTIAAVGKRDGLPDHAVTVALAAALQESELRNLDYGDRDSVGLFQQRPSQGWGTIDQIMDPGHAAAAFYQRLGQVDGWQTMAVTDAAQRVQRSAAPSAYAKWEDEARIMAQALTGEVPAGFACRVDIRKGAAVSARLSEAMGSELGPVVAHDAITEAQGWTAAAWLVGHASEHNLTTVAYAGRRWTAKKGVWESAPGAALTTVQIG